MEADSPRAVSSGPEEILIRPGRGILHFDPHELWNYRDLFWALSLRTLSVRYKQTVVGIAWAVLKPLITMAIVTIVFEFFLRQSSSTAPYWLLVYAGVLPWTFFGNTLSQNTLSLVTNANILSKVYFPRILLPASSYPAYLLDFALAFAIYLALGSAYGQAPTIRVLLVPAVLLLIMLSSFGAGLLFSVLNVRFRDIQFAVPFLLQLGLYLSPVGYATIEKVPAEWRFVYSLNPMVGAIESFRWAVLPDAPAPEAVSILLSVAVSLALILLGLVCFRRMERTFADEI